MPLGLTKKLGSFRGKKQTDQYSPGGSLGSCDPDILHSLPIGGELKVDDKGNVTTTTPPSGSQSEGETQPSSLRGDGSFSNSDDEEAHSFDSIDTISERSSRNEDIEAEKHHRMKKMFKYSQWIKKRTEGGEQKEEESRSVLALERKMARQEEKLDKLYAQKS